MRGSFAAGRQTLRALLAATNDATRRTTAAQHRLEAGRARTDTRAWVMQRRERTHHLIELGGLVQKAGLVELTGDDRAALYGAFLTLAMMAQGEDREHTLALWRRGGKRAFENDNPPVRPPSRANP
ncbi:conjugal transfer protein TraD [Caulobacter sp. DWR1-3-2b1]|uniref:conjugal transfer protein TraD n=1 Tax=Caulobacter sp. DWR1-3-2b1 TaxID=2804670 RepID=UPI003CF1C34B